MHTTRSKSIQIEFSFFLDLFFFILEHDDPVYQFLDKKRSEGKPYYVYMTAGGTKFLRHYYGKVRDCLKEKGLWNNFVDDSRDSE